MDAGTTQGGSALMGEPVELREACDCPRGADGVRTHPADCPAVAFIREVQKRLLPSLIEMDRVRRRGAAEASNYVIG